MRERILLVGEDFGRSPEKYHNDLYALTGSSGRRFAALCGYEGNDMLCYLLEFERTNVVELPEQWRDRDVVDLGVGLILERMRREHPRTILLGRRVARAFGLGDAEQFVWERRWTTDIPGYEIALFPHPSARNHWWNEPENTARARAFLAGRDDAAAPE